MTALGSRELGYEQQSEVRSAITKSSNEAILSLFHALEGIKDGLVGASEAVEASSETVGTATPSSPPNRRRPER